MGRLTSNRYDNLACGPARLEGSRVIEGTGVTHLYYRVRKDG